MKSIKTSENHPLISIPLGYQDNIDAEAWADPVNEYEKSPLNQNSAEITDVILGKWTRLDQEGNYSKCEQLTPAEINDFKSLLENEGISIDDLSKFSDKFISNLIQKPNSKINWIPATRETLSEIYLARKSFIKTLRPENSLIINNKTTTSKVIAASIPSKPRVLKNIEIPQRLANLYLEAPTEEYNKNTQEANITSSEYCLDHKSKNSVHATDSDFEASKNIESKIIKKIRIPAIDRIIKTTINSCIENHLELTENSIWETLTSAEFMKVEGIKYKEKDERREIQILTAKNEWSKKSYSKRAIWAKAKQQI